MEKKLVLGGIVLVVGILALRQTYHAPKADVAVQELATQVDADVEALDQDMAQDIDQDMGQDIDEAEELDETGAPVKKAAPKSPEAGHECSGPDCDHDHGK